MKIAQLIIASAFALTANFAYAGELGDFCTTGLSMGKTIATDCSINAELDGKTYCFGNEEAKEMYMKDPQGVVDKATKFYSKVQFGGHCTTGLSMGKLIATDCSIQVSRGGKVYCFGNEEAKEMYMQQPKTIIKKATAFYNSEMKK
ncbi:hypothetical protein [Methylotenera sp.]|uniref:hypothetical protein n=1 Tax=Methylotenera sp. TaxID=2051956 RepID=UPI0027256BCE|nr:hypothetical protein [Methylotenera sp.]MDO9206466.1 hypothetical protein [Methylotenera sp.]MDP1521691.1 hypothetical protein [Methylotenera sp.]MDP2071202.1 hypothetical protein [Methylotenera sp.]MDP2230126.1 hypothetical protein [Methylotenera sp.]MDP3004601.1 hypothetical protein [Methylotenera sp.]